jgi:GAF domain-containing protein
MLNDVLKPAVGQDKPELYRQLVESLTGLLGAERDLIANAANMSALLFMTLPDVNWAGVYFMRGGELVLGPFQGKPACVRIALGAGVCGTAAARGTSVIVQDVHDFPRHIACDAASASELVVPLVVDGRIAGVLDLDSPVPGRFDADDQAGIEALAAIFINASD